MRERDDMEPWQGIFQAQLDFVDPAADVEAMLSQVPAKWVVYLFADGDDQPVQLLCVRNLRASLKRRLGGDESLEPSRRVNYRQIVRRVYWRRVDSSFEADLAYLEAARAVFPESYRGMIGFRPAWFIHVDPDAPFPRYTKTIDLSKSGQRIGPVEDKHAAQRLIELVEDAFDLCRYYNILIDAPQGRACAYKQMHKCPAPCDGSIAMEQYRRLIEWSAQVLIDPRQMIQQQQRRMAAAAAELRFEAAAKIKAFIQQLSQFAAGPFRHARRLDDFAFLSLQRGPRAGTAKAFLVTPGRVSEILGLVGAPRPSQVLERALAAAHETPRHPIDEVAAEVIGVVAHHLFQPRTAQGVFLPLDQIDEPSIARAWSALMRQKAPADGSDEGVLRELAAMRS